MAVGTGPDRYVIQICPHDTAPFGELCEAFAQAAEMAGFKSLIFILDRASADPIEGAIYLNAKKIKSARRLANAMRGHLPKGRYNHQFGLVLCHRYRALKVGLWGGLPQEKIVCLAHEYGFFDSRLRQWLRRVLAKHAHFAGVSNDIARELSQVTNYHAVLPNVLTEKVLLSREEAREQLGLADSATVIGVVGRLHYKKRPLKAIEAVAALRKTVPDAELVFLGEGDRSLLGEIPDWVRVLGNRPKASTFMKAFDVLLHVGNVESFGMVILEAMAAGVPTAVGQFPGPEFVLGDLGYFAETDSAVGFADAMQKALTQNDTDVWADRARQRVEQKFSLSATSRRIAALVEFVAVAESVGEGDFSF